MTMYDVTNQTEYYIVKIFVKFTNIESKMEMLKDFCTVPIQKPFF